MDTESVGNLLLQVAVVESKGCLVFGGHVNQRVSVQTLMEPDDPGM